MSATSALGAQQLKVGSCGAMLRTCTTHRTYNLLKGLHNFRTYALRARLRRPLFIR